MTQMNRTTCFTLTCMPWLVNHARNIHSQYGEDGLIAGALERIGETNRWCFEVGAGDGITLSNVAALIDQNWSAVLIERDDAEYAELAARYGSNSQVRSIHAHVMPWTIDAILAQAGAPADMDLGIIDIDEQDFWLWAGMQLYRPRVMLVECAVYQPIDQLPPLSLNGRAPNSHIQTGVAEICQLGIAKGYVPVARTLCNVLFVRKDCL